MIQIYSLISSFLLVGISRAQNVTLPTDILTNMKSSLEAAGAGAINFGPSGILGNIAGQFGVKINKEQTTSGNTAKLVSKRSISKLHPTKRDMMAKLENTKLAVKSMKNCFGFPQNFPVINIVVTQPPSTTTGGTPDVRGASTTAST